MSEAGRVICGVAFSSEEADETALNIAYHRCHVRVQDAVLTSADGLTMKVFAIVADLRQAKADHRK